MTTAAPPVPLEGRAMRRRFGARHVAAASLLAALAVVATRDAWSDIVRIAMRDEEQSHVLLVPVVAAWLVWVRRRRLRRYAPTGQWAGPALVALGAVIAAIGAGALFQAMGHFGALLVVVGAFLTIAGGGLLLRLAPAFASLAFLVPVPGRVREAVALPLQSASARVTEAVLGTLGVGVERFGNLLRVGGHDVAVAEACNGLRLAFALFLVTFAFAYGAPLRNGVRVALVLASPFVAIAFNVVRLVPTVWAHGHLSDASAESVHGVAGWLMLPLAFLTLLAVMRLCRWAQLPVTPHVLAHGI